MAIPMSEYERRRQANIADNKRVLAALGLLDPENDKPSLELILNLKTQKSDHTSSKEPAKKRVKKASVVLSEVSNNSELGSQLSGPIRRSARKQEKAAAELNISLQDLDDIDVKPKLRAPPNRESFYGPIPGVEVGTSYMTRMEFCVMAVHRPPVAGIHGGPDGAYSIALSGGYEDDIDRGEFFTYTGEGGRDLRGTSNKPKNLRTAPQSKEQTLTRGNLALKRNTETGNPVRVIRGYKLRSPYAPEEGYRYDGLYTVEKAWFTSGLSGFGVWKFAMKRCTDQPPPPWNYLDGPTEEPMTEDAQPEIPPVAAFQRKRKISEVSSSSESEEEYDASISDIEPLPKEPKTGINSEITDDHLAVQKAKIVESNNDQLPKPISVHENCEKEETVQIMGKDEDATERLQKHHKTEEELVESKDLTEQADFETELGSNDPPVNMNAGNIDNIVEEKVPEPQEKSSQETPQIDNIKEISNEQVAVENVPGDGDSDEPTKETEPSHMEESSAAENELIQEKSETHKDVDSLADLASAAVPSTME